MVKIKSTGVFLTLMLFASLTTMIVASCNRTNKTNGNTPVVTDPTKQQVKSESFSAFLDQVDSDRVALVKIHQLGYSLDIELKNKQKCMTGFPPNFDIRKALEGKVKIIIVD